MTEWTHRPTTLALASRLRTTPGFMHLLVLSVSGASSQLPLDLLGQGYWNEASSQEVSICAARGTGCRVSDQGKEIRDTINPERRDCHR